MLHSEAEMEYYTVQDVMNMLGVGRTTAYKIANMTGVPTMRLGRSIRIEKSGFDKWRNRAIGKQIEIGL